VTQDTTNPKPLAIVFTGFLGFGKTTSLPAKLAMVFRMGESGVGVGVQHSRAKWEQIALGPRTSQAV